MLPKQMKVLSLALLAASATSHAADNTLQPLLQSMCKSHPGVQIQQLEVESLNAQHEAVSSRDWTPELTLTAGPQYGDGEPVGFFAIEGVDDQNAPVGPNGEMISNTSGSAAYGLARAELNIPLYKNSQWIGEESPDARIVTSKLGYEKAKVQQVFQANALELIEVAISGNEIVAREGLLQQNLKDAEAQLEIAETAARAKIIDRAELLSVEQNVQVARGELKKVAKSRLFVVEKMAFYTQQQGEAAFPDIPLQTLPSVGTVDELVDSYQAGNTDLLMQEKLVSIAEQNLAKVRDENGITLGVKSTYETVADKELSNGKALSLTGLNLEVPIDEMYSSRKAARYWALQVQKEKQKLVYLRENLRIQTAERYNEYQQEVVNLENAHASLTRARQEYDISQELFRKGRINSQELIETRSKITEIEIGKLQTYAKLWRLYYKLQPTAQWTCMNTPAES